MDFNPQQIHLDDSQITEADAPFPPVYLVSGNIGALAEHALRTVLPQFQDVQVPLVKRPRVQTSKQVASIVAQAAKTQGVILHTLVDNDLRLLMNQLAAEQGVMVIDLIGPLLEYFMGVFGQEPMGKPGLYRYKNQEYFDRIDAIEFTLAHDDGAFRFVDLPPGHYSVRVDPGGGHRYHIVSITIQDRNAGRDHPRGKYDADGRFGR